MATRAKRQPALTRHKGRGLARVRIGGRDYYGPPWGRGKKPSADAEAWYQTMLDRWRAAGGHLPDVERPTVADAVLTAADPKRSLTVCELIDRYLAWAEQNYHRPDGTPTGTYDVIRNACRYLQPWFSMPAADYGAPQLIETRAHIISTAGKRAKVPIVDDAGNQLVDERGKPVFEMRRVRPPALKTVNDFTNRIAAAFRWGTERGLVSGVAADLVAVRSLDRSKPEGARTTDEVPPVDDDVFLATRDALEKPLADLLTVLRLSGARVGEIRNMTPREIVTVGDDGKPLDVWLLLPTWHKTRHKGKPAVRYLNRECQRILRPYLKNRADDAVVFDAGEAALACCDRRRAARQTPMTPSAQRRYDAAKRDFKSKPYERNAINKAIRRACKRAGVPVWTAGQCRHSAGTQARRIAGKLDPAQGLLGHADPRTTQRYAVLTSEPAIAVAKKMRLPRKKPKKSDRN